MCPKSDVGEPGAPLGPQGPPWTQNGSQRHQITSKSHHNFPQITKILPKVGRNFGRVQILALTPKTTKEKMVGVPPCISYFFVARFLGRVRPEEKNTSTSHSSHQTLEIRIGGTGRKAFTILFFELIGKTYSISSSLVSTAPSSSPFPPSDMVIFTLSIWTFGERRLEQPKNNKRIHF